MTLWFYIGIGLILWVLYELYYGVTWMWRPIYRSEEPIFYWCITLLWVLLAIWTTVTGLGWA